MATILAMYAIQIQIAALAILETFPQLFLMTLCRYVKRK